MRVDTGSFEDLAGRVRQLENRLAALDRIAGLFYDAGYADASSPEPPAARAGRPARARHLKVVGGGR